MKLLEISTYVPVRADLSKSLREWRTSRGYKVEEMEEQEEEEEEGDSGRKLRSRN